MTKLIDLMELYRILNHSDDNELLLTDIMEAAQLDERIDRTVLADTIVAECGSMFPRWNTTTVFKRLGTAFFKREAREIEHDLDTLALSYNPLDEYEDYGAELVDESTGETKTRTDNLTSKRTDDLTSERTDNLTSERTDDLQEERTPNYSEETTAGTGSQTDHYVSADNEAALEVRTRDVTTVAGQTVAHTGTDTVTKTGTQTTADTGTQTTTNTGTETTVNTGTQTNQNYFNRDFSKQTEKRGRKRTGADLIREEILANHFNIYEIIVERFTDQMMMGVY